MGFKAKLQRIGMAGNWFPMEELGGLIIGINRDIRICPKSLPASQVCRESVSASLTPADILAAKCDEMTHWKFQEVNFAVNSQGNPRN